MEIFNNALLTNITIFIIIIIYHYNYQYFRIWKYSVLPKVEMQGKLIAVVYTICIWNL